jgi:hypothetical protein
MRLAMPASCCISAAALEGGIPVMDLVAREQGIIWTIETSEQSYEGSKRSHPFRLRFDDHWVSTVTSKALSVVFTVLWSFVTFAT